MGSRYLVTGVQLGMLKGFARVIGSETHKENIHEVVDKILNDQCVGETQNDIDVDCKVISDSNLLDRRYYASGRNP